MLKSNHHHHTGETIEFITNTVDQLNWWAILLATLSTMPIGYIWYDLKIGFGKHWAKLNGLSEKELGSSEGMTKTFGMMIALSFATAFFMACLIKATGITGFWDSFVFGVILGGIFRAGAHIIHDGFTKKPIELTLINAGHDIASLAVMAVIIGLWQ
jgi:hypothetical protein